MGSGKPEKDARTTAALTSSDSTECGGGGGTFVIVGPNFNPNGETIRITADCSTAILQNFLLPQLEALGVDSGICQKLGGTAQTTRGGMETSQGLHVRPTVANFFLREHF